MKGINSTQVVTEIFMKARFSVGSDTHHRTLQQPNPDVTYFLGTSTVTRHHNPQYLRGRHGHLHNSSRSHPSLCQSSRSPTQSWKMDSELETEDKWDQVHAHNARNFKSLRLSCIRKAPSLYLGKRSDFLTQGQYVSSV